MHSTRKVTDDIVYVGVEDRRLHLFENLFPLDRGISYNSYLILDEKTALLDSCDQTVGRQYFENVEYALSGRKLDYLIVNHMEPDHCALIDEVLRRYPSALVVSNAKTFQMIEQFFYALPEERKLLVKEGDELSLGRHKLSFYFAPMVHWPEVMFTYDETEKILFTADAFGVFGCNNGNLFADELDCRAKDFVDDARRYYTNIVGKYGAQTQNAMKKAAKLSIRMLCPLHGPVWRKEEDLSFILDLYDSWSRYEAEERGVTFFYNSVYGNTDSAVNSLCMRLGERGIRNIRAFDVSKTEQSFCISECFRVTNLVFAGTTYNNGLFPKMEDLLLDMKALSVQNKKVSLIENGSWAPQSGRLMKEYFDSMKGIEYVGDLLTIRSAAFSEEAMEKLADAIASSLKEEKKD